MQFIRYQQWEGIEPSSDVKQSVGGYSDAWVCRMEVSLNLILCWEQNNIMWESTVLELCSTLTEIILQTRLEVKRALLDHFKAVFNSFRNRKAVIPSIDHFLEDILPKQLYHIRKKLLREHPQSTKFMKVQVNFYLIHRGSGLRSAAECWSIQISQRQAIEKGGIRMIADFFSEVIRVLNKLPLFSIYHKEKEMRSKYMLNWDFYLAPQSFSSLLDLKGKHFVRRHNGQLAIQLSVSYLPSLNQLWKPILEMPKNERKDSMVHSDYGGQSKVSIFEFHDPELEFTFLSSDEEVPSNGKIQNTSQQIVINLENDHSGSWEMLYLNEEEDFLATNKIDLDLFLTAEKAYIQ